MHLEDYIDQPTGCVLIHTLSRADGMFKKGYGKTLTASTSSYSSLV